MGYELQMILAKSIQMNKMQYGDFPRILSY